MHDVPLTYPLLRVDSLKATSTAIELGIWLPWMRSLPWACVTRIDLEVDGRPVSPGSVVAAVDGREIGLDDVAGLPGYWIVGTPVVLRVPWPTPDTGECLVRVEVGCAIPYIYGADGPLRVTSRATSPARRPIVRPDESAPSPTTVDANS